MRLISHKIILILLSLLAFNTAAKADATNTIIVFDASGSMWGQIEGVSKIEIAREAFANVKDSWQASNGNIGLIAYGHNRKGDCADIELLVDPNGGSIAAVGNAIKKLKPKGKTPLSDAVRMAAEQLHYQEEKATVILFSDGIETCRADPCALSAELAIDGINFTAHVIGFGIAKAKDKAQLQCIADNSGGQYFDANNADDLRAALNNVAGLESETIKTEQANTQISDLSIQIEIKKGSTRPHLLKVRATNLSTSEKINFGKLEGFAKMIGGIHTQLAYGDWKIEIISKEGTGSIDVNINEKRQKINIPFSPHGMQFEMVLDGPYQLGTEHAIFLNSINNLQPNVTLIVAMFPAGSTDYKDRMDYEYRMGTDPIGVTLHGFTAPKTAGDYEIVVLHGRDMSKALAKFPITYVEDVVPQWHGSLKGEVGGQLPVRISGNAYRNNPLTIEKDGKKILTNNLSRMKTIDGPMLQLPDVAGEYQLIYQYKNFAGKWLTVELGTLIVGNVVLEDDPDAVEPPTLGGQGLSADEHGWEPSNIPSNVITSLRQKHEDDEYVMICAKKNCFYSDEKLGLKDIPLIGDFALLEPYFYKTGELNLMLVNIWNGEWVEVNPRMMTDAKAFCVRSGTMSYHGQDPDTATDSICTVAGSNTYTLEMFEVIEAWIVDRNVALEAKTRADHEKAMGGEEDAGVPLGVVHGNWELRHLETDEVLLKTQVTHSRDDAWGKGEANRIDTTLFGPNPSEKNSLGVLVERDSEFKISEIEVHFRVNGTMKAGNFERPKNWQKINDVWTGVFRFDSDTSFPAKFVRRTDDWSADAAYVAFDESHENIAKKPYVSMVTNCFSADICQISSAKNNLYWTLPRYWRSSLPTHVLLADGSYSPKVSINMQKYDNGKLFKIILNGVEAWDGECFQITAGELCRPHNPTDLLLSEFEMVMSGLNDVIAGDILNQQQIDVLITKMKAN